MSIVNIRRVTLQCEGCGVLLDGEHDSTSTARAVAYAAGWRFPPRTRLDGTAARVTCDICPQCAPTWKPPMSKTSAIWAAKQQQHGEAS